MLIYIPARRVEFDLEVSSLRLVASMQILISFSLGARRAGSLVSKHAVILFIYFIYLFFYYYLKLVKFDFDFVCYF